MVFSVSVGEAGALLAGAGVVVAVVVVVVVGVWLPLVPQAVLSAPIAMSTAPPATAIRRRSTLRAFICNPDLRITFLARAIRETIRSSYCHHESNTARGQWPWVRMSRVLARQHEHVAATIANPIQ